MKPLQRAAWITAVLLASTAALANRVDLLSAKEFRSPYLDSIYAAAQPSNDLLNINYVGNSTGTIIFNPATQTFSLNGIIDVVSGGGPNGRQTLTGDLGTITFTSGPLQSGSLFTSAIFNGGTLTITFNGTDGLTAGTYLSLNLGGPLHWNYIGLGLYGFHSGYLEQQFYASGNNQFNVVYGAYSVPEPDTLALTAAGFLPIIGLLRRRIRPLPGSNGA